jgi:hypothetical protein
VLVNNESFDIYLHRRGRRGVGSPAEVTRLIAIAGCMIRRGTGIHRHGRRGVGSPAEVTRFITIAGCMIHRGTGIHRQGRRGVGSPAEVTRLIAIAGCRFRRYHRQLNHIGNEERLYILICKYIYNLFIYIYLLDLV